MGPGFLCRGFHVHDSIRSSIRSAAHRKFPEFCFFRFVQELTLFARIVKKELLHYLLDLRFIGVFALSAMISLLSVYAGIRTYSKQSQQYDTVFEKDRNYMKRSIQSNDLWALQSFGYPWNRKPEVLSPPGIRNVGKTRPGRTNSP